MVGRYARPSETMLKAMAMLPTRVKYQRSRPVRERAPQIQSSGPSCQKDFLLKNEAIKMVRGEKPTMKVRSDWIPTPCFISAVKAMKGASDQRKKLTRLGLTLPFRVSKK